LKRTFSRAIIQLVTSSLFTIIIHASVFQRSYSTEASWVTTMPPMKGMTLNAWSNEAYNSSDFDQSITNLANIKANWVTFTVFWFMENHTDTEIHPRPDKNHDGIRQHVHSPSRIHRIQTLQTTSPLEN